MSTITNRQAADYIARRQEFRNGSGTLRGLSGSPKSHRFSTGWLRTPYRQKLTADVNAGRIDYVVWSYDTPIAWHVVGSHGLIVPPCVYSPTTTQHQHIARMADDTTTTYQESVDRAREYANVPRRARVGDVVYVDPSTDLWMRGVRSGVVQKIGREYLHIFHDESGRTYRVAFSRAMLGYYYSDPARSSAADWETHTEAHARTPYLD